MSIFFDNKRKLFKIGKPKFLEDFAGSLDQKPKNKCF